MLTYTTLNCFSENIRLAYLPKPKCESGTTCLDEGVVFLGTPLPYPLNIKSCSQDIYTQKGKGRLQKNTRFQKSATLFYCVYLVFGSIY